MAELALGIVGAVPVAVSLWPIAVWTLPMIILGLCTHASLQTIIGRVQRFFEDGRTLKDLMQQTEDILAACDEFDGLDDMVGDIRQCVQQCRCLFHWLKP